MVEAEFLFELLMRRLTDPPGFDRGGERLEARIGRQVRHIVFLLAGRPAFADEPAILNGAVWAEIFGFPGLGFLIQEVEVLILDRLLTGRHDACRP